VPDLASSDPRFVILQNVISPQEDHHTTFSRQAIPALIQLMVDQSLIFTIKLTAVCGTNIGGGGLIIIWESLSNVCRYGLPALSIVHHFLASSLMILCSLDLNLDSHPSTFITVAEISCL
jgi:hypothetical protein